MAKTPSPEQLTEITKPPILAVLSTANADGSPQATPVWYLYDGEYFNVTAYTHRVKVQNIARDPRVVLTVLDTVGYGEPLRVLGRASLVSEGVDRATERVAIRYEGERAGRESAARLNAAGDRVIIRIKPTRIRYGD